MNDVERILVIDDDVELCSLVSEYLRPEGFQVEAVHDGKTGLTRAMSGVNSTKSGLRPNAVE